MEEFAGLGLGLGVGLALGLGLLGALLCDGLALDETLGAAVGAGAGGGLVGALGALLDEGRCAKTVEENNRIDATTRLESRI
jgi:hypothetical protein